ncbi:acyl-CoA dehydrogenase family protein [Litorivita sp. NS0012-18]|uniref:acyl-CoA dehydrogenase family protein n=1 Tax=Litorivita sp. NS0012-18 TaxID=3127655 RepID=UPI0031038464
MSAHVDEDTFQQIKQMVRRFTHERLIPTEQEVEETDALPESLVDEMKELGLFGLSVPEQYGGMGLSLTQEFEVIAEVGQAALAFRSVFGTNVGIGSQGIVIDGTKEQKQQWLPGLATGDVIASFALTEPDAGSDAGGLSTRALRDGDDFVINGTKRYITNANRATILSLMARTDPDQKGARGISAFIVPTDTQGITIGKHDKKMGQKGTRTCDITFENVRVPAANIIGGTERLNQGFKTAMKVLDRGRIHMAALAVGQARRLINEAAGYAIDRKQFGQSISQFQLVQAMLADSRAELYASETMARDAARKFDAGEPITTEAACVKMFSTEAVGRIADRAVQIFGGAGYMSEYPVERIYRDVRLMRIYEGTTQIQQLIIARNLIADHTNGTRL